MPDPDDHRSLAQRLDLCHFAEHAPGMVYWHPRGYVLYRLLERAARNLVEADGYFEVRTPQLVRRPVWNTSGHWDSFASGMFRLHDGSFDAALKPVSCPGHISVAKQMVGSYRDLPLRLAEFGIVHRDEPGGTLHGLLRLRQFTQDDGHVFCREDHIEEELDRFCGGIERFYRAFGFASPQVALSTRPPERDGEDANWDRTEAALRGALDRLGLPYAVQEGAGAFYGPKIEFSIADRCGRSWQCGTIQLDVLMPRRFGLRYQAANGERRPVVMLHRALYGSVERFLGLLLEHHRGALPPWMAPEQIRVVPVSVHQHAYAGDIKRALDSCGLRVSVDAGDDSLGRRVADARTAAVPFIAIVGEEECRTRTVTLRDRAGQQVLPLADCGEELGDRCKMPDFEMREPSPGGKASGER
jgi:threonyl-tRNA synthetase